MEVSWVESNSPYLVQGTKPWSKLRDTGKNRNKNVWSEWCYYNIKNFFTLIHMKSVHQLCLSKIYEKYTCKNVLHITKSFHILPFSYFSKSTCAKLYLTQALWNLECNLWLSKIRILKLAPPTEYMSNK